MSVPSQNTKVFVALNATAQTTTTEFAYGPRIDCKGADSATFIVHIEATNATGTHGLAAIRLEESDLTTTASFVAISGLELTSTSGYSAATSAGDVTVAASAPVAFLSTSLVGKKRFLRIGARKHSSATGAVKVQAVCILDNLAAAGSNASGATGIKIG